MNCCDAEGGQITSGLEEPRLAVGVEFRARFGPLQTPQNQISAILSSYMAIDGGQQGFLGPNVVGLMAVRRGTYAPGSGSIRSFVLETSNWDPARTDLLACCCSCCFARNGSPPYPGYVHQTAEVTRRAYPARFLRPILAGDLGARYFVKAAWVG